ncbi:MAG TPA: methyltransferase domain-containing protein [Gammaproteobacteria bacterium]|nr:methyltransferase domain-containing protein [Gammaproteobacteria bacterium]
MGISQSVPAYDSQSKEYEQAFEVFLKNTNQKRNMHQWLQKVVEKLPAKQVFIDAGAGDGEVTRWFTPLFQKTIAIEPNPFLREKLHSAIPEATIIDKTIMEADPQATADLVLCSHILYYIDKNQWLQNLEKLVSWLSPSGSVIIVLQNPNTDCMNLLEHFINQRFDLSQVAEQFAKKHGENYEINLCCDGAQIEAPDFSSALTISIFMLNLLPMPHPLSETELEYYISSHFLKEDHIYRFSCNQDFLQIRKK